MWYTNNFFTLIKYKIFTLLFVLFNDISKSILKINFVIKILTVLKKKLTELRQLRENFASIRKVLVNNSLILICFIANKSIDAEKSGSLFCNFFLLDIELMFSGSPCRGNLNV